MEKQDNTMRERAKELTGRLTLEEKIGMIHGAQLFQTAGVKRLQIPPLKMSDGPMGVRQEFEPDSWKEAGQNDDYVTYLPCNSALSATWNRALAHDMGSVLGEEARGRGKDVILAPGINLKRSPLCGRNFEYFSEDPYLTKEMAVPLIQGIQQWDVAACVKHFAVNNQETQRLWVDVKIDETVLRKLYLPAFYDAVTRGGAYTIMGAYNQLYGEHCSQSDFLLRQILRQEWGYDGVVISDWGAVHDTKQAALSSLDIEMSVTDDFDRYNMARPLQERIEAGELAEEVVDEKVVRILMLMMRLHMLDGERKEGAYNTREHQQKALEIARESVILLKNSRHRLPLQKKTLKKLLVIGENAVCLHANGGGSAQIRALYEISPLMGLKMQLGGNTDVQYVPGYCREETVAEEDTNWQETSLLPRDTDQIKADGTALARKREALRKEAVALAGAYETVLYIGGLNHEYDCEGADRKDMKLPYEQDILLQELLAVRPEMIVVLFGGSAVEMHRWIDQADTLVWSYYAGMEGGNALAEVLLGRINPSGKLPETFYRTLQDCSAHQIGEFPGGEKVAYREGRYVGYRYNNTFDKLPQFYFGHGLSYTNFKYDGLDIAQDKREISFDVQNAGTMAGSETVQLYLAGEKKEGSVFQELIGFDKVFLQGGEKKHITLHIEDGIRLAEGDVLLIGSSSKDTRLVGRW